MSSRKVKCYCLVYNGCCCFFRINHRSCLDKQNWDKIDIYFNSPAQIYGNLSFHLDIYYTPYLFCLVLSFFHGTGFVSILVCKTDNIEADYKLFCERLESATVQPYLGVAFNVLYNFYEGLADDCPNRVDVFCSLLRVAGEFFYLTDNHVTEKKLCMSVLVIFYLH